MTTIIIVIKFLHVLAGFWLFAGGLGRWSTVVQAAKALNIQSVRDLMKLAGHFEQRMITPAVPTVLVLGLITAWLEGWPILGFLQGASSNWLLVSLVLFLGNVPLVFLVFLPRGKLFELALDQAVAQGKVTPELTAELTHRSVFWSYVYQTASAVVIIALMIAKPF